MYSLGYITAAYRFPFQSDEYIYGYFPSNGYSYGYFQSRLDYNFNLLGNNAKSIYWVRNSKYRD
jgi:hypothetical protein